jgi:Fic family protein
MRPEDFAPTSPGQLVKNLEGAWAFVPSPLPPAVDLRDLDLFKVVARAGAALGRVAGFAKLLPSDGIMAKAFVRREALLSSYIENTFARYEEMSEPANALEQAQLHEVQNAERALQFGLTSVLEHGRPISAALVREMHAVLLRDVRGNRHQPGQFRSKQVYIGQADLGPEHARFVPPPSLGVPGLIDDLMRYVNARDDLPPIVRAALVHYQFETIHPFEDGNGRLGRALVLLQLCAEGELSVPVLNASLHFERNRREYYDALQAVSERGDWLRWLRFFATGIHVAAEHSFERLNALLNLRKQLGDAVHALTRSSVALKLLDQLFVNPQISIKDAATTLEMSEPGAKKIIDRFMSAGILRETTGRERNRVYVGEAILKLLAVDPSGA